MDRISRTVLSAALATLAIVAVSASSSVGVVSTSSSSVSDSVRSQDSTVAGSVPVTPHRSVSVRSVAHTVAEYTIRRGDTLTSIAKEQLGSSSRWPALWYANRNKVRNPDLISTGDSLAIPSSSLKGRWLTRKAMAAIPKRIRRTVQTDSYVTTPEVSSAEISTSGMSAFQACVISRESGGQPQVMNASGHYGLYQFAYSTWVGNGGNPADFGHASVAEQNQVFDNAYAADGTSPWAPYDGC